MNLIELWLFDFYCFIKQNNLKQIFKKTIAMRLKELGNPIEDAVPNLKNSKFVIYVFKNTDKLQKDLSLIQKELTQTK